ncbi:ATP-binding cassette domain-containing protein [Brevifollis gellanilyticus]|nr:ATP-binding cassette domain-containing protein [Brevifollis gellanilyticus]
MPRPLIQRPPEPAGPVDKARRWWHRLLGRGPSEGVQISATRDSMLPVLIEVFAGFSKLDGEVEEEEIERSLGYLRYDYSGAIYSDMRRLYFEALQEPQNLGERAKDLSGQLAMDQKILLCVQLYLLISQSVSNQRQMVEFYLFMTNLGIAAQAIDIVYQLNAGDRAPEEEFVTKSGQPLETLIIGPTDASSVVLRSLSPGCTVTAFRYQNLVLIKNTGKVPILVRSRRVLPGDFSRLYPGERVLLEDVTLDFNDLTSYFNAKKTVTGSQLYLILTDTGDAEISSQRTRGTNLRVSFGLGVTVEALRNTDATLNNIPLREGTRIEASIEDKIIAHGEIEIALRDLRVRAGEFGGQFRLEGSRNTYLVSNKPELLEEGDILLSEDTEGEILLRIECNYTQKTGTLEVLRSSRPLYIGLVPVRDRIALSDGDTITLGEGQFLRCHFSDRIIEEEKNVIRQMEVRELSHRFDNKDTALDGISFIARRGEMICVMGPSGCGKSTLLRVLGGQLKTRGGEVLMNGLSLYGNRRNLTPYIAYIPQEDAFDPLLKVQENLDFSVAIRCPHLKEEERRKRVEAKLAELGLADMRKRLAGTPEQKYLSGGERKRLNAGLDMIGISDVYLFDEPTSGLSSKDSEHVLEIIRSLARNKLVLVSIHQPSMRLLQMFDKALLLDKGGKMAFFGTPQGLLEYFWKAYNDETGQREASMPANITPDFVFDVLETPLHDISGDIIQERSVDGHMVAARRFPPNFWRDRYQSHLLLESMAKVQAMPGATNVISRPRKDDTNTASPRSRTVPKPPKHSLREESILFVTNLERAFLSKLRNRTNLLTTLLEAPLLAFLISSVLKYSEEENYTFATAFHIPTYLFMSLVVAMFLGLTNSADEIIRDRHLLKRERNHNLRTFYYLCGKVISLSTFALVQCVIYLLIGNNVLEIRDMFWVHLWWMFITSLTGACLGLLISCVVNDNRAAINAIPLILIPQIILGGALIKYEEMNKNLDFVYSVTRWLERAGVTDENEPSKLKVPFICQFMPLRWSYEAMLISQAKLNPLTSTQDQLEARIQELVDQPKEIKMTKDQQRELDTAKQALAVVSGLYARDADEAVDLLNDIRADSIHGRLETQLLNKALERQDGVSAEEVYVNRKVLDLVTKAEMEREDYRRKRSPNVFFGTTKRYFGTEFSTLWINGLVMFFIMVILLTSLELSLRRQLTKV